MALLIGEFESTIDAKHRLAISASLRDQVNPREDGKDFILVLGPDRHLWLYPDLYYRRLLATMRRSPLPDRQTRKIDLLFAMARPLKCDAQGRVVLPEKSMQRAVIEAQVTLVGILDHIEIWPSPEWEQHVQEGLPTYGEVLYEAGERARAEALHRVRGETGEVARTEGGIPPT
jgi:MraZ protein